MKFFNCYKEKLIKTKWLRNSTGFLIKVLKMWCNYNEVFNCFNKKLFKTKWLRNSTGFLIKVLQGFCYYNEVI